MNAVEKYLQFAEGMNRPIHVSPDVIKEIRDALPAFNDKRPELGLPIIDFIYVSASGTHTVTGTDHNYSHIDCGWQFVEARPETK